MVAPFTHPYRTSPDTLNDIRHDLNGLLAHLPKLAPITPPASLDAARALWMRQALEAAADHAAALLPLLDAPILVEADTVTFDRSAALDALDAAVVALDALDADADLEDEPDDEAGGDDELSLGWREAVRQLDLGHASDDGEPTLGAPERSPYTPPIGAGFYRPGNGRRLQRCFVTRACNQAQWAAGDNVDGEGESEEGYDLPEGDDERCGSEHDGCEPEDHEPELGSPIGDGDQRRWAQGLLMDVEADPCDGPGAYLTPEKRQAARDRRPEMRALARRAQALARPVPLSYFDPDTVTPIRPGMVSWGGPAPRGICNVHHVAARVVPSGGSLLLEVEA